MQPMIYSYWEGERPALIELCLQSLQRWNPGRVHVLQHSDFPAELRDSTRGLCAAYRSDLFRLWVLHEFGGLWVDADTICVGEVPEVDEAAKLDLFGVFNPYQSHGSAADGLLASPLGGRAGSPILNTMFEACQRALQEHGKGGRIPYASTSTGLASLAWRRWRHSESVVRRQHWQLHRVPWYRARKVFGRSGRPGEHEFSDFWNPNAKLYHLTHAVVDRFCSQSRSELLDGRTFLSFLLQKAFSRPPAIYGRTKEILKRLPASACRGAEVGVFRAMNARFLLQQRKDLELDLVDRWSEYPAGGYRLTGDYQAHFDAARWERLFSQVVPRHLNFAKGRYQLHRTCSTHAAAQVPDRSLDFVFIDSDHSYEAVRADLESWLPKVKPGGFIGGHDYGHPREGSGYGVQRAVDQFAISYEQAVDTGQDYTWFFRVTKTAAKMAAT